MIWVEGNEKSQFYADRTEASWKRAGYTNVKRISGTTPETLEGIFEFTKNRTYPSGRVRNWNDVEFAIWESHYKAWEMASRCRSGAIIIEHDAMFYQGARIPRGTNLYPLYSLGVSKGKQKGTYSCIAAAAYWIWPTVAESFMQFKNETIAGPVDGYIHAYEPWYPRSPISREYARQWLPVKHFIDPKVGTIKKNLLEVYNRYGEKHNIPSVRGEEE